MPGLQEDIKAKLDKVEAAKLEGWSGVPAQPPAGYEPSKVAPPAGGTESVALSGDQLVQVGALPVSIGKASPTEATPAPPAPSGTWSVAVETRTATEAANVDGALIKVTPPVDGATPVDVQLDYKQFKDLYGTEWSTRLELKQLPECFLTTPDLPECSVSKDVPSTNDPATGTVRATVDPATSPGQGLRTMALSGGGGGPMVLAATDGGSGAGGTYTATSLSSSGSWTAGGSGGGFSWTYPLSVPPTPAGPSPSIAFSYSSQAVDGRTSAANGQASWIGDGWGYEPGFIERRYRSCAQDRKASSGTPNTANSGAHDATEQSQTRTRYFRGMSGDAGRPKVTFKDSTGTEDLGEDLPQLQGLAAETITYTKAGGTVASRQLTWPWSQKTATRSRDGTTPLEAFRSGTLRTDSLESISEGRTRLVRSQNTYDEGYGLLAKTQIDAMTSNGTGWTTSETSCTATTYVHNPAGNLIGLAQQVRTTAGDCTKTATGVVLSDTRTSYDALDAFGTAPVKGLPVQVDTNDAAGTGWITSSRTEYDALGRAVKVYDAAGNFTKTSFSPAVGTAFSTTATNPLNHSATTKVDPGRGSVLQITDANSRKVNSAYDNLGRVTSVWTPSQTPSVNKPAYKFDYQISEHEPPVVTSSTLRDNGTYEASVAIFDGLLRPRQTQKEGLGGGRLITDTLYSSNGTVSRTNDNYRAEGEPEKKIFVPETDFHVPHATKTAYDGLGRIVRSTTVYSDAAETPNSTTVEYGGDWTLTRTGMSAGTVPSPLQGSRAVKTTTDDLGRTTLVQHAVTTTSPLTWRDTKYEYDVRGKLTKVTDPVSNSWKYTYDSRGRMTSSDDPDMGKSSSTYNNLDQQASTTNSAGVSQFSVYDALGRTTEVRSDTADGTLLASWTYDTLPGAKGLAVAATRYSGGAAYKSEVTGYDSEYRPTGSKITIPDVPATKGLAGTYAYSTTYTPTGKVQSTNLPATPGGLAAEKLITRYDADGMPQTMSGKAWYTAETVHSPFGEVLRTASGSAPNRVWATNRYNPSTGRVTESTSDRETADYNRLSQVSYKYDPVGNVNSITDTQPGGRVDRQCFAYDALGQLTEAWTGKTEACAGPGGPTLADVTPGPDGDGYWQKYQFDSIGNRTKLIDKDLTSEALDDTTTYTYGVNIAGNGTQPPVTIQPHALVKTEKATVKPGSTVNSLSTYTYDAAGNTKSRTIGGDTQNLTWDRQNKLTSASSPGVGAVAVTGLAGKCLDVAEGSAADGTAVQLWPCNETRAQQWRLTGDTVRALDKCLTADGLYARLSTCDGSAKQKFTYRTGDKTLYNAAAGGCVTVPNDNSADGTDLHIFTCAANAAAQQWTFADNTTYLYDAAGNRLIEETGSSRTLSLGEAEITVDKAGQAVSAARYYTSPGGPTTVRTTEGKATGHKLNVLLTDHHNTATVTVEQSAGQKVTRRKSDPYGNQRGATASNWPGSRGFLGSGVEDTNTGLTHIGAREYDASTGRFISVDPVIDITDPLQMNGYTYSNADPVNRSDPSGLCQGRDPHGSGCSAAIPGKVYVTPDNPATTRPPKGDSGGTSTVVVQKSGKSVVVNSVYIPTHKELVAQYKWASSKHTYAQDLQTWTRSQCQPTSMSEDRASFCDVAGSMGWMGTTADVDMLEVVGLRDPYDCVIGGEGGACKDAATGLAIDAAIAAATWGVGKAGKVVFKMIKAGLKKGDSIPIECLTDMAANSFPAGTLVQLADGSVKAIEDLENGDEVLATDPETGETTAQPVVAGIATETDKNYVELTLAANGATASVVTTGHHPVWSESEQAWIDAAQLRPGMTLRTDEGDSVALAASRAFEARQRTYNLTVAEVHTYYVLAGDIPVLVHNANTPKTCPKNGLNLSSKLPDKMPDNIAAAYDAVKRGELPSHDTYSGREHQSWAGAKEYRVPGDPGDKQRILVIDYGNGVKKMGWTTTHYEKIQQFGAPHFPDSGWVAPK
ncbi:ricin-type beta-trefoil lectin domain protein [Streptomyces sp. ISL-43]|nr:ricin-type beta-trefoil lectin domain protein [Streptomyces sp. ISL-43]